MRIGAIDVPEYTIKYDSKGAPILPNIWRKCRTLKEYWWYIIYFRDLNKPIVIPFEFSKKVLAKFFYTYRLKEHQFFRVTSYQHIIDHNIPLIGAYVWVKIKAYEKVNPKLIYNELKDGDRKPKRVRRQLNRRAERRGIRKHFYKIADKTSQTSQLYQNEVKDILQGNIPWTMKYRGY